MGLRSAEMVVVEIGGSWRTIEMFAVLTVWAVIGRLLALSLLRRMARRQSGSAVPVEIVFSLKRFKRLGE
jgi:ABC-2 type transport system permease protein